MGNPAACASGDNKPSGPRNTQTSFNFVQLRHEPVKDVPFHTGALLSNAPHRDKL